MYSIAETVKFIGGKLSQGGEGGVGNPRAGQGKQTLYLEQT